MPERRYLKNSIAAIYVIRSLSFWFLRPCESVFQKDVVARVPVFIFRIVIAYVMTAMVGGISIDLFR